MDMPQDLHKLNLSTTNLIDKTIIKSQNMNNKSNNNKFLFDNRAKSASSSGASSPILSCSSTISTTNTVCLTTSSSTSLNNSCLIVNNNNSNSSNDLSTGFIQCSVCGDRATGKHYGANSCDGCKGFFRRSVRKNHMYTCRFKKSCIIDKDKRNQCRFCRLKKCFRAGMIKEAVQNERDRIAIHKRVSITNENDDLSLTVNTLYNSEIMVRQIGAQMVETTPQKIATANDIADSMKQQLLLLVEWAKSIKVFCDLSTDDKIALLKTHAGENLILGAARRSLRCTDVLVLGNGSIICVNKPDCEISRIASSVHDLIVKPLRDIQINDYEFACLKAIVFFDPNSRGISDPVRIKKIRSQIQINLEDYVNEERLYDSRGRFGEMLLLLPTLHNLSHQMIEIVQCMKLYGTAKIDCLLTEMLLDSGETTNEPYVTIIQDPYPPLNNSPNLFEQLSNYIRHDECIDTSSSIIANELTSSTTINNNENNQTNNNNNNNDDDNDDDDNDLLNEFNFKRFHNKTMKKEYFQFPINTIAITNKISSPIGDTANINDLNNIEMKDFYSNITI